MATTELDALIARNPATGAELGRVPATPLEELDAIVARARSAQAGWGAIGWKGRREVLERWWRIVSRDAETWADLIRDEIGKPRAEALAGDVIGTLDGLRWTVRHAGRALAGRRLGAGSQRFLLMPDGRLEHRPIGVVGVVGTWNYPLFLNAPVIAQALAAGNAVVWKPSELAALCGLRLAQSVSEAGFPEGLFAAVFGGPEVGRALAEAAIDKGFFTGGIENGRRVLAALGARGIPAVAELSGYDPAVVLPDAPRASTVRNLAWGAFVSAGQTCVAVKRVYVVGDPAPWAKALGEFAATLRIGNPAGDDVEIGPMISYAARERFHEFVRAAIDAGAQVVQGGAPLDGPGSFYPPTVLLADGPGPETALAGAFGPVVIVRGVGEIGAAITAANGSRFGLAASVWSRDGRAARAVAARLDAGMVTINEVVTPTMHASAPFGGVKASGFGRTHGAAGLLEFTQPQVIFNRRAGGFRPHLFPYRARAVVAFLRTYKRMFH
jgi:acyl-CoA reductase-like NAD-dependent aldehyde dehydrogenase